MTEVEVFWPAGSPIESCQVALRPLEEHGIETTCHQLRVSRSAETAVLVLVASTTLQPFLSALFDGIGADAHRSLRRFVRSLLRGESETPAAQSPRAVIFESSATGAQFVFTDGLPAEAYEQAIALDPEGRRGRWAWADAHDTWVPLEETGA